MHRNALEFHMTKPAFAYTVQAVSLKGRRNEDIAAFQSAQDAFNFAALKHNSEFGDAWHVYIWEEATSQCAFLGTQRGVFYARNMAAEAA